MSEPTSKARRPDYGIDAPGAVRNLAIGGAAALGLTAVALALRWTQVARMAAPVAIGGLFGAGWMVWESKIGKVRGRGHILSRPPWQRRQR